MPTRGYAHKLRAAVHHQIYIYYRAAYFASKHHSSAVKSIVIPRVSLPPLDAMSALILRFRFGLRYCVFRRPRSPIKDTNLRYVIILYIITFNRIARIISLGSHLSLSKVFIAMVKRSYVFVKIFQIIWKIKMHLPFALCRQRPMAGRREDERRGDHEDTGRISRFCKGHNRGLPLRRCDHCRPACSRAGTPWPRSIASCLSVVPDCELPVGPSSDDRTLCRRRNIKPERRIIDLRIYIRNIRERRKRYSIPDRYL